MPIKGLSDQRRITRGGYIRLGEIATNKNGKEYPVKSDHFIADFDDKNVEALFHKLYGDEPKRITVAFPSDDADKFFPQFYKCYGASTGLKCKGDGETANRAIDGEMKEVPCPGPNDCEFAAANGSHGKPGCKRMGSIQFFIKGLPGLNVFQVNTTSWNSIVNLNSGIDMLRWVRQNKSISGVWVDLVLKEQEAQADGKKVNIYAMSLDIPVSLDNVAQLTSTFEAPAQLPAPSDERDPLLNPVNGFAPEVDTVDEQTGEIKQPKQTPSTTAATAADLTQDTDIVAAMGSANLPDAVRSAVMGWIRDNNPSKARALSFIASKAAKPASSPANGNGAHTEPGETKHDAAAAPAPSRRRSARQDDPREQAPPRTAPAGPSPARSPQPVAAVVAPDDVDF